MVPQFIIIGAPKAGSTSLHLLLRNHPSIFMPKDEDLYFHDPFYSGDTAGYFARIFANAPPKSVCGIKHPTYMSSVVCAQRIKSDVPNVKLIALLRDPVSRAISDYYHKMRFGLIPIVPLEIGMRKLLSGEWSEGNVRQVLDFGMYGRQLQQYLQYFDSKRILVLGETFSSAALNDAKSEVANFLGIDQRAYVEEKNHGKKNEGVYNLGALRVISALNKARYSNRMTPEGHYMPSKGGADRLIDLAYAAALRGALVSTKVVDNTKPRLSSSIVAELRNYYAEDIALLEHLTGYSFPDWKNSAARQKAFAF